MSAPKSQPRSKSILMPALVSSTPIVWAQTNEEYRMVDYERDFLIRAKSASQVFLYDATGVTREASIAGKDGVPTGGRECHFDHPKKAIEWFSKAIPDDYKKPAKLPVLGCAEDYAPPGSIFVMFDLAAQLQHAPGSRHSSPVLTRVLKNATVRLTDANKMIVIVSHTMDIPQELEHTAVLVEHPLPDAVDLGRLVQTACHYFRDETNDPTMTLVMNQDQVDIVVGHITGMTLLEADNVLAQAVYANKIKRVENPDHPIEFDIPTICRERVKAVRKNSALEVITPIGGLDQVGGHGELKSYIKRARRRFTREARGEGLSSPKGILLCGISGGGKTLLTSCIAGEWGAKILRGDVGACKAGLVGASESNFRKLLKDAEDQAGNNAPVVLQLDEAGKMFGGGLKGAQSLDSGVTTGLSAIFLTWRQECKKDVYVIMTANEDAQNFPMEWLRPGRIDKVFFIDLPTQPDREEVFHIHLKRRNWPTDGLDIPALAKASDGFTPAEIEQAVEAGIDIKLEEKGPRPAPLEQDHLLRAIQGIRPMSTTNKDEVDAFREWAVERGYSSGRPETAAAPAAAKPKRAERRVASALAAAANAGDDEAPAAS